jgi:hypothetical protein
MMPFASARVELTPEAAREKIRARLGHLPRRLGAFAELALAGLIELPEPMPGSALILGTSTGPRAETRLVLDDLGAGLALMPFGFIQSQIGVSLAALAAQCPGLARATTVFATGPFWPEAGALAAGWLEEGLPQVFAGYVECRNEAAGISSWSCWRAKDC